MLWTDDRLPMPSLWHAVFAVLLLFVGAVAGAQTMWLDPPNADQHTPVDAIVSGRWIDDCVPVVSDVSIAGSTITVRLVANTFGCLFVTTPYRNIVHLGVLPPGKYTVIAMMNTTTRGRSELARRTLVVRDVDTLHVSPYAITTAGGRVQIDAKSPTNITIDGVPAKFTFAGDAAFVDAPPHAAGAVDVAVMQGTATLVAKSALIYYDPHDADPALFEPILFPLALEGIDEFGSRWTTESSVWVGSIAFRDPIVTGRLPNVSQPWGQVLYARREPAGTFHLALTLFSSRLRELSKQPYSAGTEVPIVRERDFRDQRLWFLNAPVGTNLRATLRVWSLDPDDDVSYSAALSPIHVPLSKVPGTSLYFGSVDITKQTGNLVRVGSDSGLPRIWAMITYVDNDTQQVTIATPHQE